ncbi:uncharacterized protein MONOS_12800 [Monocercomonoides exilis]|uniref:uncharacterized protein n=1 Tax=Monocercomonoides exilis TaxID=2049356 RepID=UPI0035596CAF|nr:hypothetical protein MONOS_12800 [Monocercomonoides exilis]|eukprot:MONOS_12800.1-p1 / transcript=MONOS_12800.1 / gene=MONOS_12800 / organism=Monocercomonoides_exilis_PA203 / gene_product=unspecified product / transcript_product=unspecified product / location=Mono_scaffold00734:17634-18208(-) / protein_length=139 / sequence_SO=supercontig / SO=protein_coding / is_pseudo=false
MASALRAERRKGYRLEEPKAKTKTEEKEKDKFFPQQVDAFDTRLAQAQQKEGGEKSGGDDDDNDELRQWLCLFDSALSSAQLHTQNAASSSAIATPPFSPLHHTQLSAPSVLVGTPPSISRLHLQLQTHLLSHRSPST